MMIEKRKPEWLRRKIDSGKNLYNVNMLLEKYSLNTVCREANCPNLGECFSKKTATFLILGKVCTRGCTFCNISKGKPEPVDSDEPAHIAGAVLELGLKYVVITSVTRDDLPDGGAGHFYKVINKVKGLNKEIGIEVLIPDFMGDKKALLKIIKAGPDVINHNIETVPSLYNQVRPQAVYSRSLQLLKNIKALSGQIITKSGIMLGLGEKEKEVIAVFKDLREVQCDFLTIGQYLSPSANHYSVVDYIHPDKFKEYKDRALNMGFKAVASAPFVRSSYNAADMFKIEVQSKPLNL